MGINFSRLLFYCAIYLSILELFHLFTVFFFLFTNITIYSHTSTLISNIWLQIKNGRNKNNFSPTQQDSSRPQHRLCNFILPYRARRKNDKAFLSDNLFGLNSSAILRRQINFQQYSPSFYQSINFNLHLTQQTSEMLGVRGWSFARKKGEMASWRKQISMSWNVDIYDDTFSFFRLPSRHIGREGRQAEKDTARSIKLIARHNPRNAPSHTNGIEKRKFRLVYDIPPKT